MKIAIPAEGPTLDSRVAGVFGRCGFMLLVDSSTEGITRLAEVRLRSFPEGIVLFKPNDQVFGLCP